VRRVKRNRIHAQQRAQERFDAELTRDDRISMIAQITASPPRAFFLQKKRKTSSKWLVWWPSANQWAPVVYCKKQQDIVTVLPANAKEMEFAPSPSEIERRMLALDERHQAKLAVLRSLSAPPPP
jgi:hypothetical protein